MSIIIYMMWVINIAAGDFSKGKSPRVKKPASEDGEVDDVFVE